MAINKPGVTDSLSNQTAIVKRLAQENAKNTKTFMVPGGKTMTKELSAEDLKYGLNNWLRFTKTFTSWRLNFIKDLDSIKTNAETVVEFPRGAHPIWELPDHGRTWLAEQLARVIRSTPCVAVEVTENGIKVYKEVVSKNGKPKATPDSDMWEPHVVVTVKNSTYA